MGDGDDENGWVRARNYKGEEGYVPQNYVEVEMEGDETEGQTSASGLPLQPQISFSSVDYHVQEKMITTEAAMDDNINKSNVISNGYYADQNEDENQNLPQEGTPTVPTSVSSGLTTPFINELRHGGK